MMNGKRLLISHIADEDGITPVILSKLVFKDIDFILVNPEETSKCYLENVDNYDFVYITDLNISEELAAKIDKDDTLKSKTLIFDHHKSNMGLNKYDFITVITLKNNRKECATSIFYEYLCSISDNEILHKESTRGLTEQVRIIDTYDFKSKEDEGAHKLGLLFSILGRDNFIDYFDKYIRCHDVFEYTEKEEFLIKLEKDRMDNYLSQKKDEVMRVNIDGYKTMVVYAERYRSELGNYLVNLYNDIDFAVIINVSRGVSYRGAGKVDLSVFASKYGGGGHMDASGNSIPSDLLKNITKLIFKNVYFEEDENE